MPFINVVCVVRLALTSLTLCRVFPAIPSPGHTSISADVASCTCLGKPQAALTGSADARFFFHDAHPMRVFIQLNDDCNGTYVNTSSAGFDVYELRLSTSDASFSHRVVAKRKGYEDEWMRATEVGYDDPNLYPEQSDGIFDRINSGKRTE